LLYDLFCLFFFFSSRRRHTRSKRDWSSDVCSSDLFPSISLKITFGRDTWSSNPSRRIFSIRIDKCNSPRPETIHASGDSVGSTLKETSVCNWVCSRSSILLAVTHFPSRPAKGELFTKKVIC